MKEITSKIIINAPKELVWEVLTNLDDYKRWNLFTPKIETNFEEGSTVILHVNMNPGKKKIVQKETLLWFKPLESMAWGITSSFPVKTERAQILSAIDSHTTEYLTYDRFWGVLTPLVMFFYREKIQRGFDSVAQGLKNYCEQQYASSSH